MELKALVLDWGGVLIENPADELLEITGLQKGVSPIRLKSGFGDALVEFQKGILNEYEFWQKVGENLGVELNRESIWLDAVRQSFKLKPRVVQLLEFWHKQIGPCYLLSNTEKPTVQYFFEQKWDRYFDGCFFSCEMGLVKPFPEIYEKMLLHLNLQAQEILYIDDLLDNLSVPYELGMQTFHFSNDQEFERMLTQKRWLC